MSAAWTVVKVGGSLFDWPLLPDRLRAFVASLQSARVLLVPGGGATAHAIRAYDRTFALGDEVSHWLAIQALSVNARLLQAIMPGAVIYANVADAFGAVAILDAHLFFLDDETRPEHLPHRWDVTSDSLAVRAACLIKASELVLLKSVSWCGDDWQQAAAAGVVDAYFPVALQQIKNSLEVRVVNLRASED